MPTPGAINRCTCAAPSLAQTPRDLSTLTEREGTVLLLVATGLGNTPIARRLDITERTVKKHITSLLHKLRVTSRLEAALIAHHQHHELCRFVSSSPQPSLAPRHHLA
ncbi:LuxR C-terminal-related transcriptional regulator [Streptomyces katrae]|uniref:LuxR C-terminal-related transcriptional regulator n=1 Tax=Streptomyces katrae TaxID=68223 RepID=A0ABT7GYB6_9ACTN|nr:LuxR C-terminal-related transcriptional regulator [Streptomyces katrae]MDK9498622.1 LuxR C-terminal-related transcriptional regulator [Streptomyces katrae]